MDKKFTRGFTLIELLVVIAIIGILASVVLGSLSGARVRANTAAFKSEITSMHPTLVSACDQANLVAATDAPATVKRAQGVIAGGASCGPNGNGTFSVSFAAAGGVQGTCTSGTVTETAVTFAGC